MKYSDCGKVWIGNTRPFTEWREIDRGKNKGKIEVILPERKVIVCKEDIERYPKGEL